MWPSEGGEREKHQRDREHYGSGSASVHLCTLQKTCGDSEQGPSVRAPSYTHMLLHWKEGESLVHQETALTGGFFFFAACCRPLSCYSPAQPFRLLL